jgi:hypothetical protein
MLRVTLDDIPGENRIFILNIARIRGIDGIFIKALPPTVGIIVEDYYNELFSRHELLRLSELKEYPEIGAAGIVGFRQAVLFWGEL